MQAVRLWLSSQDAVKKWLMVVDNADDLSLDIRSIIPRGPGGSVIITSQDSQATMLLGGRAASLRVDVMMEAEAVLLLLKSVGCQGVDPNSEVVRLAKEVVTALDYFPLAINLASGRILADIDHDDDMVVAMRRYLEDFRRHQNELLRNNDFVEITSNKKSVWTAWETSLDALRKMENEASGLSPMSFLSFLCQLDWANVQDELFRLASRGWTKALQQLHVEVPGWLSLGVKLDEDGKWDRYYYDKNSRALQRYGLIRTIRNEWSGVTMHNLVKWRVDQEAESEDSWRLIAIFMAAVCSETVNDDDNSIAFRRYLIPHLPATDTMLHKSIAGSDNGKIWMLNVFAKVWRHAGGWYECGRLLEEELGLRNRALGEDCTTSLNTMLELGETKRHVGLFLVAVNLEEKVLHRRIGSFGESHAETLRAMIALAQTYWYQGLQIEAESLVTKVYEARMSILGGKDLDTMVAMAWMANIMITRGQWREGADIEEKVLAGRSRRLGKRHPDTLRAMVWLANTYHSNGESHKAELLLEQAVQDWEIVVGKDHFEYLGAIGSFATCRSQQGRYAEAEELQVQVLEAWRRVSGEEHPDTLIAIEDLASTYWKQGRYAEAEELEVQVLEARQRALGKEHPNTLLAIANLASTYWKQGRHTEAEELEVQVLEARQRVLGNEHPHTLMAMHNLALSYSKQGKHEEAQELREALEKIHSSSKTTTEGLAGMDSLSLERP